MNYFICETPYDSLNRGAWGKGHRDINEILESNGYQPLVLEQSDRTGLNYYLRHFWCFHRWNQLLFDLKKGDTCVVQFPPLENSVFLHISIRRATRKGIKIIPIVFDLPTLLNEPALKKAAFQVEEPQVLKYSSSIIVHNPVMKDILEKKYALSGLIALEIFDYIIPDYDEVRMNQRKIDKTQPIIVAGNLDPNKTGYLYKLPDNCQFNLYGVGYKEQSVDNVHYYGSYSSEELPYFLNGSFGLIWDGDSPDTCAGIFGEYLKLNNPHKTSLYLASGLPIIVWDQAAISKFVINNGCGIAVSSLWQIADVIENMTNEQYAAMKKNVTVVGERLRQGYYLSTALRKTS